MLIQINTDHNIDGHDLLTSRTREVVESALRHLRDYLTRVEVHLSDENGPKEGGPTKRCMMEARMAAHQPLAVTSHAPTLEQAVELAVDKLTRLIEHTRGRLQQRDERPGESVSGNSVPAAEA